MITAIVTACSAFGITVPEAEAKIMRMQTKRWGEGGRSTSMRPASYTNKRLSLCIWAGPSARTETQHRDVTASSGGLDVLLAVYKMEMCDRPGVHLRLRVRLLKAVVIEILLYGCMTWRPNKPNYEKLRQVHHFMLLRCLG